MSDPIKAQKRSIILESGYDPDTRLFSASVSSEYPVMRMVPGVGRVEEVLMHDRNSINLERLNGGFPILFNHDSNKPIGRVDSASVEDGKLRIRGRMANGKSQEQQQHNSNMEDGIYREFSIGYDINEYDIERREKNVPIMRVKRWTIFEASIAPVPADPTVGVGRSQEEISPPAEVVVIAPEAVAAAERSNQQTNQPKMETTTTTAAPPISAGYTAGEKRTQTFGSFDSYQDAMAKTRDLLKADDDSFADALSRNQSPAEFAELVRSKQPATPIQTAQPLGMSRKEVKEYSLLRAIQMRIANKWDGLEKEAHEAMQKVCKRDAQPNGFFIPNEVWHGNRNHITIDGNGNIRAGQNVTTAGDGGFLVGTQTGPMIELLRAKLVLARLGVTMLDGLTSNIALPVQSGASTSYWLSETGETTVSTLAFQQKAITPHRLATRCQYSSTFLAQSSQDAESLLRNDMMTSAALKKDLAGLEGSGVSGEPLGLYNTATPAASWSSTVTWAEVVAHETNINTANADIGSIAWALTPAAVGEFKTTPRLPTYGNSYMIEGNLLNGYRYETTTQITGDKSFFGVWSQLVLASFQGTEVIVDPYTNSATNVINITMHELCDVMVRQPTAFSISNDSVVTGS